MVIFSFAGTCQFVVCLRCKLSNFGGRNRSFRNASWSDPRHFFNHHLRNSTLRGTCNRLRHLQFLFRPCPSGFRARGRKLMGIYGSSILLRGRRRVCFDYTLSNSPIQTTAAVLARASVALIQHRSNDRLRKIERNIFNRANFQLWV